MSKSWILAAVLLSVMPVADAASNGGPDVGVVPTSADNASASDKAALEQYISKLSTFEADFKQKVIDADGKFIMQGHGKVQLSHPSLIRWHALAPDENILVSDGQTLWMHNIDLEQVTALDAKQAIDSTPFALLASNDPALWRNYNVSRIDGGFAIVPKVLSGQVAKLRVYFEQQKFSRLVIEDVSGQHSEFTFVDVKTNQVLAKSLFSFKVPEGVELDDQRP